MGILKFGQISFIYYNISPKSTVFDKNGKAKMHKKGWNNGVMIFFGQWNNGVQEFFWLQNNGVRTFLSTQNNGVIWLFWGIQKWNFPAVSSHTFWPPPGTKRERKAKNIENFENYGIRLFYVSINSSSNTEIAM